MCSNPNVEEKSFKIKYVLPCLNDGVSYDGSLCNRSREADLALKVEKRSAVYIVRHHSVSSEAGDSDYFYLDKKPRDGEGRGSRFNSGFQGEDLDPKHIHYNT